MVNPTGKKLEKLLFGIFDEAIQGVDTYKHNGSIWLIITDDKKWVLEYTKEQNLWYNYYFFKQEMDMVGLDCVENKDLIQKWFESRFLNRNEVKEIDKSNSNYRLCVENTIRNGVKNTESTSCVSLKSVEDTIQNGVKDTLAESIPDSFGINDAIQNGVKHTLDIADGYQSRVEDTIQNGVKYCEDGDWLDGDERFEDIIQNGVKNILDDDIVDYKKLEDTIQNGIKEK